jgi:hypothetical protein
MYLSCQVTWCPQARGAEMEAWMVTLSTKPGHLDDVAGFFDDAVVAEIAGSLAAGDSSCSHSCRPTVTRWTAPRSASAGSPARRTHPSRLSNEKASVTGSCLESGEEGFVGRGNTASSIPATVTILARHSDPPRQPAMVHIALHGDASRATAIKAARQALATTDHLALALAGHLIPREARHAPSEAPRPVAGPDRASGAPASR